MTKADESLSGRADACCCSVDIHIEAKGDVNVYACTPAGKGDGGSPAPECPPRSCDPIAPGQCLPLTLGAKPKQSARTKRDAILASSKVPSALAAGFFRHARRYLAGETPGNPFEAEAFALFRAMPEDMRGLLRCADASIRALPTADRNRLLDPGILAGSGPLDALTLATALGVEIGRRGRDAQFDDPDAVERPGQNRFFDVPPGEENFDVQLRICSVNDLRTVNFIPPLTPGDYLPTEFQQACTLVVVNGVTQASCQTQSGNCPGQSLADGACLRVPDVEAGGSVVLKGVNFISTDAKVRLEARPPLTLVREVDAFVYGDLDTPLSEVIDGQVVTIRDCRVHDQITFKVPDDLPAGVYGIQVVEPNVSGFPNLGDPLVSNQEFIAVVPPAGALYTIASEKLVAREETSPAFFGSDEVRVRVRAYPVTLSDTGLVLGDEQAFELAGVRRSRFRRDAGDGRGSLCQQRADRRRRAVGDGLRDRQRSRLPRPDQQLQRCLLALPEDRRDRRLCRRRGRGAGARAEGSAAPRARASDPARDRRGAGAGRGDLRRGVGTGRSDHRRCDRPDPAGFWRP
ncbi:MAG: hypothetical protein QM699_08530 [Amaricoccus sp.]|uniref:hypothetical protein n=1 Tax=Amaricoccus sp. TaxID=1872485 RepID=UPI0039E4DF74